MIIKSLKVDKFRKLNNFEIDLGRKITILSGHNGTMKSTILGLLMQPFDVTSKSTLQKLDKENFMTTHLKYPESKFGEHFKFVYPKYDRPKGLQATLFLHDEIHPENQYSFETILRKEKDKPVSLRIWAKGDRGSGSGFIKDIPVIFLPLSRLYPLQLSNYKTLKLADLAPDEQKLFISMFNDVFKDTSLNITNIFPLDSNIPHKFSFGFESPQYDHVSMSSGEDSISNIIGSIISIVRIISKFKSNDAMYKGSVLFIDEIDASLHPPIQINLMNLLIKYSSKYKIQFVVTTHSIDIIEWAYHKRDSCLKNAATKNDLNIIYLISHSTKIKSHQNPELHKLYNHLKLTKGSKISLYTEDASAAILLKGLIESKLDKEIEIKPAKLGSSDLLPIIVKKEFTVTDNVILCLDGDQKKIYSDKYGRSTPLDQIPNLVFLPGKNNPEHYIYHFLKNLDDEHDIWDEEFEGNFYKANIMNSAPKSSEFLHHSIETGIWFRNLFDEVIIDKNKFFNILIRERRSDVDKLNAQLKKAILFVKSNNLVLSSVGLEEQHSKSSEFENNQHLMLVNEIFEYAINCEELKFHPRDTDIDSYNKLNSSEKKFIYQLFRSLYTPDYFIESPYKDGFIKK